MLRLRHLAPRHRLKVFGASQQIVTVRVTVRISVRLIPYYWDP
jgi:hypothetical protein